MQTRNFRIHDGVRNSLQWLSDTQGNPCWWRVFTKTNRPIRAAIRSSWPTLQTAVGMEVDPRNRRRFHEIAHP